MSQPTWILLCARTARSIAYLQALAASGLQPSAVIVYGEQKKSISSSRNIHVQHFHDLFCPDLLVDLDQWLIQQEWSCYYNNNSDLNSATLHAYLTSLTPDLIVYSGYGGQLVPSELLALAPVLHVHSGWLPDYRGSTTLYYQVIDQGFCSASALLLDEKIDTGPVLLRKNYPLPPAGVDVDYLYDNAIRADLLVIAINQWLQVGCMNSVISQTGFQQPYYIIHPLLKHLAVLSIDKNEVLHECE